MDNISFELYEDNAGRYHLFAINEDGIPFAGFETTQKADILSAIVGADEPDAEDPSNWDYQYGDDISEGKRHTQEDISAAYAEITGWVNERNGGAWELDIEK